MITTTLTFDDGRWFVNGYGIAGNPDDGYTVWCEADGEDSDTLYDSVSFERCLVWALNS